MHCKQNKIGLFIIIYNYFIYVPFKQNKIGLFIIIYNYFFFNFLCEENEIQ